MEIQTKKEIRKYVKDIKKSMSNDQVLNDSKKIEKLLMEQAEYKNAENIYIYINYNQEVITTNIINKSLKEGKNVYVPKIYNDVMKFHKINTIEEDLVLSAYGILEPTNDCIDESRDGLLIMPGLAFDKQFNRIGYGGGFFDKYLTLTNTHIKLALAYNFQIFNMIAADEFDIKVDIIITPDNVMKSNLE